MKKLLLLLLLSPMIGGSALAQGCQAYFYANTNGCPQILFYEYASVDSLNGDYITSWNWNFGDGNTSTQANPVNTYAANGNYQVCLNITTQQGCTSSYCETVNINCSGGGSCQAGFYQDSSFCPTVNLINTSTSGAGIWSYFYDFGDGSTSTSPNPSHTYTANGNYQVCLTITAQDSCTSTYCEDVTITCLGGGGGNCQAGFYRDSSFCPTLNLWNTSTSNSGIISYYYNFGDGSTSTSPNPSHTYAANGNYLVCLTVTAADSCTDTYCEYVTIDCIGGNGNCSALFTQDSSFACPNFIVYDASTASSQFLSYTYDYGDGATSSGPNGNHVYTANGTYVICLTITTADSCTSTYCETVVVDCIAGLEENMLENSYVSPNPAQHQLTLHLEQAREVHYRILGLNGAVYDQGVRPAQHAHQFELDGLSQGMYLLEIESQGAREVLRFIRE